MKKGGKGSSFANADNDLQAKQEKLASCSCTCKLQLFANEAHRWQVIHHELASLNGTCKMVNSWQEARQVQRQRLQGRLQTTPKVTCFNSSSACWWSLHRKGRAEAVEVTEFTECAAVRGAA